MASPPHPGLREPRGPLAGDRQLAHLCADAGYELRERLTIYPEYLADDDFLDPAVRPHVSALAGEDGLARDQVPIVAGAPA